MSKEIAELIGINYGDGNLYYNKRKNHYIISYSGDLRWDLEYMEHINKLFNDIFQQKMSKYFVPTTNSFILSFRSKTVYNYLGKFLEIPQGPKNNLRLPNIVKFDS